MMVRLSRLSCARTRKPDEPKMKHSVRLCALVASLFGLLAACASPTTLEEAPSGDDALASAMVGASGERTASGSGVPLFDRLAADVPGFGGLYRTSRCDVVLVLTGGGEPLDALRTVQAALKPLVAADCALTVRAVPGQFTYVELHRYLASARRLNGLEGVVETRIDYVLNRLVVVVTSRPAAQSVEAALPRVGVPAAAVTIVLSAATGS